MIIVFSYALLCFLYQNFYNEKIRFVLIVVIIHAAISVFSQSLSEYVDPFIGTGVVNGNSLSGNTFPGATVPFGMVQLSPETRDEPGWDAASGYYYNDTLIYGFSHTQLSGTGVAELFDVLVMHTVEEFRINSGKKIPIEIAI